GRARRRYRLDVRAEGCGCRPYAAARARVGRPGPDPGRLPSQSLLVAGAARSDPISCAAGARRVPRPALLVILLSPQLRAIAATLRGICRRPCRRDACVLAGAV